MLTKRDDCAPRGGTRTTPNAPPRLGLWSSLAACRSAGIVVAGSTIHGMRHSSDARHLLRELDAELLAVSNRTGRSLVWTAQDRAVLELIADTVDRRVDLAAEYAAAEDT